MLTLADFDIAGTKYTWNLIFLTRRTFLPAFSLYDCCSLSPKLSLVVVKLVIVRCSRIASLPIGIVPLHYGIFQGQVL